jgi:site-specific DNA recombinase
MKKAAFYARVSTDAQQKEGTIDSQVVELKRQIAAAGQVLVKEYIDDGYSGTLLDRPALEQLRQDAKTDVFDAIYFLCADRIAREVAYQTIIVDELMKHGKQIVINGKDYIENPENKLTLTMLGAFAEFERAKIMERMMRGKLHRLRMGQVVGNGLSPFGYDYVKKTPTTPSVLVINEQQGDVVRWIFEAFTNGTGLCVITRSLEERGVRTRMGKTLWDTTYLKNLLQNPMYAGTRYYNKWTTVPSDSAPKRGKYVFRDRSVWIGVKVPAIVSQEVFDQAQVKIQQNSQRYRHPPAHQLLGGLIECGECGCAYYSYRRYWKRELLAGKRRVFHKAAYECKWRSRENTHARDRIERCRNPEIATHLLEDKVFELIRDVMLDPLKLRGAMAETEDNGRGGRRHFERRLAKIVASVAAIEEQKRHLIELYASDHLAEAEYVAQNVALDGELDRLNCEKAKLDGKRPVDEYEAIDPSIRRFSESARTRFERCADFDSKRQFLRDHVEKVIFLRSKVTIVGSVPIEQGDHQQLSAANRLAFRIEGEIDRRAILTRPKTLRSDDPRWRPGKEKLVESPIAAASTA